MARRTGGGSFGSAPGRNTGPSKPAGSGSGGSDRLSRLRGGISAGGAAVSNPDEPLVYMDGAQLTERERRGGISPNAAERKQAGRTVPLSTALAEFYSWSEGQRQRWGEYLVSVGRIDEDEVDDFEVLRDEWQVSVEEAAKFTRAGKRVSPWQAAKLLGGVAGATDEERKFSGRKSFTRKDVNLTNPEDAKGIVRAILRDQIGRAPTDDEMSEFIRVLNEAERANPQATTESVLYEEGEAVSSETTTTGGLSAEGINEILTNRARMHPDYGSYQAATRLFNALIDDVISAPV